MTKLLRPLMIAAILVSTIACKDTHADQNSKTQVVRVPGDGSFRYAIADMVQRVQGSVVSIKIEKKIPRGPQMQNPFDFFFGPGFGPQMPQQQQPEEGQEEALGSGVIVSKDGYILTNNHVVAGADKIIVTMFDEKQYPAKIIGRDEATDLAVIKIEKKPLKDLPAVEWGDSDILRVGEWVVAIGNPFGLDHTVTTGIVSAKGIHGRGLNAYENFIQVDAAINPGNSGGALLDLDGKLVGINSAILSRSGGFQGIGFAIPVNMARKVMTDLIEKGSVTRGWLGVGIQDLNEEVAKGLKLDGRKGVLITEVMPSSPAEKGGLQVGDLITTLDDKAVTNSNDLRNTIALTQPGAKIKFGFIRNGSEKSMEITITTKDGQVAVAKTDGSQGKPIEFGVTALTLDDQWRKRLNLDSKISGVVISEIQSNSSASEMGLQVGDLVVRINQIDVKNLDDFRKGVSEILKDKGGAFLIQRGGARVFIGANIP